MGEIIIPILVIFIFWLIVNIILNTLLTRSQNSEIFEIKFTLEEFALSVLRYRKTIMFNIITILVLHFFKVNFLYWAAIVYYIVIAITQGILIISSLTTELTRPENKIIINNLWLVFISKVFDELSNIITIFTLVSFTK